MIEEIKNSETYSKINVTDKETTSTDLSLSSRVKFIEAGASAFLSLEDEELESVDDEEELAVDVGFNMVPKDPDIRRMASCPLAHM